MKKSILLFILIFVTTCSFCQTKEEALKSVIDDIALTKKSLPITQSCVTIMDMEVKGNGYITYYVIDDREIDFNTYVKNLETNKAVSFLQTARNHPLFAKNLVLSGLNMVMVIKAKYSKNTRVITMMANELKDVLMSEVKRTLEK